MKTEQLPEETMILSESVRKFMDNEVRPLIEKLDHYPVVPEPEGVYQHLVASLGRLGVLSLLVPSEWSGAGLDFEMFSIVLERMAECYASIAAMVLAHTVGQKGIEEAGSEEQKRQWLAIDEEKARPPLLAFPLYLEPVTQQSGFLTGSGLGADGDITVQGTCELVVNAPIADALVLPVEGPTGVSLIVVPKGHQGVTVSHPVLTLGLRGCPVADVVIDRATVSRRMHISLSSTGSLARICEQFLGPVVALASGICKASLEKAVSYVKERRQGGRVLAEYSQIRMIISAMVRAYDTVRLAAEQLSRKEIEARADQAVSLFIVARESAARMVQDGVQLLGGYGYMEDYGQERCMRDAKQVQMIFGRDDIRCLELASDVLAY